MDSAESEPERFTGSRYLRNRELILGTYMVLSAAATAYGPHREALEMHSQSSLASLVWFSRAQCAEPLMLKGILFAVSLHATGYIADVDGQSRSLCCGHGWNRP